MIEKKTSDIDWSQMTWKGSRLLQHREHLALPFRRKIELNEELCDMGRHFIEQRKRKGLPYIDPYTGRLVPPLQ
jgi:hypothetical protein